MKDRIDPVTPPPEFCSGVLRLLALIGLTFLLLCLNT